MIADSLRFSYLIYSGKHIYSGGALLQIRLQQ